MELQSIIGVLIDIALVFVLLTVVYRSYKRGFVTSFIRLVGTVVSALVAAALRAPIANYLYQNFLKTNVRSYIAERLAQDAGRVESLSALYAAQEGIGGGRDAVLAFLSEKLEAAGLHFAFGSPDHLQQSADQIFESLANGGENLLDTVTTTLVEPAVISLLGIAVFFVLFFLFVFVIRMLARVGRGVNYVPIVGGLNRVLGAGLGVLQALLIGYLIGIAAQLLVAITGGNSPLLNTATLKGTCVLLWFMNMKLF